MQDTGESEAPVAKHQDVAAFSFHATDESETPGARRRRLLQQLIKVVRASLGMCTMGSIFTFPSVLVTDVARHNTTIYGTTISLHGYQDMVGSLVMLGSLPGAWVTAGLAMRAGRRWSMIANGLLGVAAWLGTALLPSIIGILLARCVAGLAVGGLSVAVNAYVAELADPEVRGMMSMTLNLGVMTGQLFTVSVGYNAHYFVVALVNAFIPAAFVLFLLWLPESPSLLILKGKEEAALKVLLELRGKDVDLKAEAQSYRDMNDSSGQGWGALLHPPVLKSLVVLSILFCISSFTGLMVVTANASQMFEAAGTTVNGNLSAIVIMLVQSVGNIIGFFLMDRIGRKKILCIGFFLMSISLTVLATYVGVTQQPSAREGDEVLLLTEEVREERSDGWVPLACLVVSQTGVALGVNGIPFILSQEYFPTAIRTQASSICYTVWTVATFAMLQLYTPMTEGLTLAGLYGFYASVCALGILFTALCVKETMGVRVG